MSGMPSVFRGKSSQRVWLPTKLISHGVSPAVKLAAVTTNYESPSKAIVMTKFL